VDDECHNDTDDRKFNNTDNPAMPHLADSSVERPVLTQLKHSHVEHDSRHYLRPGFSEVIAVITTVLVPVAHFGDKNGTWTRRFFSPDQT